MRGAPKRVPVRVCTDAVVTKFVGSPAMPTLEGSAVGVAVAGVRVTRSVMEIVGAAGADAGAGAEGSVRRRGSRQTRARPASARQRSSSLGPVSTGVPEVPGVPELEGDQEEDGEPGD